MKFLIQKIDKEVTHDFSFTLLESLRFLNWVRRGSDDLAKIKFFNTDSNSNLSDIEFKSYHINYIPVGSVEFVIKYFEQFYNVTPKPINVPEELFHPHYSRRPIFNGVEKDLAKGDGRWFVKSNSKIKSTCGILNINEPYELPQGEYQFSEPISIDGEWRGFVRNKQLVGLQNYSGEFTKFPNVEAIKGMINAYKSAPIAYTLDVGVNDFGTFVIECHDFFSCGLYGFNSSNLPHMFSQWFHEYVKNI